MRDSCARADFESAGRRGRVGTPVTYFAHRLELVHAGSLRRQRWSTPEPFSGRSSGAGSSRRMAATVSTAVRRSKARRPVYPTFARPKSSSFTPGSGRSGCWQVSDRDQLDGTAQGHFLRQRTADFHALYVFHHHVIRPDVAQSPGLRLQTVRRTSLPRSLRRRSGPAACRGPSTPGPYRRRRGARGFRRGRVLRQG